MFPFFVLLVATVFLASSVMAPPAPPVPPAPVVIPAPPTMPPCAEPACAELPCPCPCPCDAPAGCPCDASGVDAAALTVRGATVRLDVAPGVHGSGFCRILGDGSAWVWTAGHVVSDLRKESEWIPLLADGTRGKSVARVTYGKARISSTLLRDGSPAARHQWEAELIRYDARADLALLRITDARPLGLGSLDWSAAPSLLTEPVIYCGSPSGMDQTLGWGRISALGRRNHLGEVVDQTDCGTQPGSSGGPVCSARTGRVLGLVQGGPGEVCTTFVTATRARAWALERGVLFAYEGKSAPASLDAVRHGGVELATAGR